MRVNDLPIPAALAKAALGNEKLVQNIGTEAQINFNAAAKTETVAQTIAKLENQLFQIFFEHGPQLGQIVTQLRTLRAQELTYILGDATQDSINQNTVAKLLDSLKALFIAPQENTTQSGPGANRIQHCLVRFFGELVVVKQNANPVLQANIDKFITQILRNLPDLRGFLVQNGFKELLLTGQKYNQNNLSGSPQQNDAAEDIGGQQAKAVTPVNDDKLNGMSSEKLASLGKSIRQAVNITGHSMDDMATYTLLEMSEEPTSVVKGVRQGEAADVAEHNLADKPTNNSLKMQVPPSRLAFDEEMTMQLAQPDLSMNDKAEQTALSDLKQPQQNATLLQQKMHLLVEHLSVKDVGEHVPAELVKLLGNLSSSLKELEVDPVTQWERLLRYPVIYKQVLQRVTKLLQEFLNSKQTVDPALRQSLKDLLGEITANLHVQLAVNQLDQENSAKQQLYFQIPLQLGAEVKTGEMYIIHERKKRGNKWNLANSWYRFYMETQFIGPVDVSIQALEKQLTIKLTVTTEEQALIFNQQRVSLRKILTDSGYDVIDIACGVGIINSIYPSLKDIVHQRRVDVIV